MSGELDHNMVVDKHLGNLGDIGQPTATLEIQVAQVLPPARGVVNYGYRGCL